MKQKKIIFMVIEDLEFEELPNIAKVLDKEFKDKYTFIISTKKIETISQEELRKVLNNNCQC